MSFGLNAGSSLDRNPEAAARRNSVEYPAAQEHKTRVLSVGANRQNPQGLIYGIIKAYNYGL
jgi:hypothetical protein